LTLAGACTSTAPRTEVVLEIDADAAVRAQLQTLRVLIDVSDDGGKSWKKKLTQSFAAADVGGWRDFAWPARLGLVPEGNDLTRRFAVRVQALDKHGDIVVWQQAVAGFDRGRTTVLPIALIGACAPAALDCGDPDCVGTSHCQTCRDGKCIDVKPLKLQDFKPSRASDAGSALDGGGGADGGADSGYARDSGAGTTERDAGDAAMPPADSGTKRSDAGSDAGHKAGSDAGGDSGAPTFHVTASSPSAATPVQDDTHGALSVTFSAPVDESTVTGSTFTVTHDGQPVAGSVATSKRGATFKPDQPWELVAAYTMQLSADVQSTTGTPLAAFSLDFSARDGVWQPHALSAGLTDPIVALSSDGFGVIEWTNPNSSGTDVLASLYDLATGWSSPTPLTSSGDSASAVAINTMHHAVAVWSGISAGQSISVFTGGSSWMVPAYVQPASDAAVYLNDADELFFVASNNGTSNSLTGYQFTLGGSSPAPINVGGSATGNTESQVAVVGGTGRVIWVHDPGASNPPQIMAGLLDDSDGAALSASNRNASKPRLAATPSHTSAIVVWQQADPSAPGVYSVWASRIDSGGTWSAAVSVSKGTTSAETPAVAIDDHGRAVATWQQDGALKSASFDPASGWANPVTFTAANASNPDPASVALAPDGNGLAVWSQDSEGSSPVNEVWAARYLAGRGWSSAGPQRISDVQASTGSKVSLAIDAAGRAFAAWYANNATWVARFE
jgi:hypothetical protein